MKNCKKAEWLVMVCGENGAPRSEIRRPEYLVMQ